MKRRTFRTLALGVVIVGVAGAPAHGIVDEGGGAAQLTPTQEVRVGTFDWSDAGVGIGIGAAGGALALGAALAVRRHRIAPGDAARPAAR